MDQAGAAWFSTLFGDAPFVGRSTRFLLKGPLAKATHNFATQLFFILRSAIGPSWRQGLAGSGGSRILGFRFTIGRLSLIPSAFVQVRLCLGYNLQKNPLQAARPCRFNQ